MGTGSKFFTLCPSFGSNIPAGGMLNADLPIRLTSRGSTISTGKLLSPDPTCAFGSLELGSIEIENNDEGLLPEIALGDFLWLDDIHDDIRYEARVTSVDVFIQHHLAILKVSLRLPTDFNLNMGSRFELRLRHNRGTLRRQYHALTAALAPPRRLLFPSLSDIKPIRRLSRAEIDNLKFRQLVNRNIRDDGQQLQAVISILEQPPGSVPFIIYGPSVYIAQPHRHNCTDIPSTDLGRVRHPLLSKA